AAGTLGFPTSDEFTNAGGQRESDFEHGSITCCPAVIHSNGNAANGYHAIWTSDSYNGAPLTSITLNSQAVSNVISISVRNEGPGNFDSNTVLAYWLGGSDDGSPADGTRFCHAPGSDWYSCDPGISSWIGYATITSGQVATFQFQIQAPQVGSSFSTTMY